MRSSQARSNVGDQHCSLSDAPSVPFISVSIRPSAPPPYQLHLMPVERAERSFHFLYFFLLNRGSIVGWAHCGRASPSSILPEEDGGVAWIDA